MECCLSRRVTTTDNEDVLAAHRGCLCHGSPVIDPRAHQRLKLFDPKPAIRHALSKDDASGPDRRAVRNAHPKPVDARMKLRSFSDEADAGTEPPCLPKRP